MSAETLAEILLTTFSMWVVWKLIQAKERQEDYSSLMGAYQRARERGDEEEAKRLFAAAERRIQ